MLVPRVSHAGLRVGPADRATAHVKFADGSTAASVKQFAGCGGTTNDNVDHGKVIGRLDQREVWSKPANTVDRCTRALGVVSLGEDGWSAYTSRRC